MIRLLFLLFFVSCGKIVDSTVSSIADNAQSFIDFSEGIDPNRIKGTWVSDSSVTSVDLDSFYDDSTYFEETKFNKTAQFPLDFKQCELSVENKIVEVSSQLVFEFLGKSYKYFAIANIQNKNNDLSECLLEIGKGQYSILGSYLYLEDLKMYLGVELTEGSSEIYFRFTE
jgi:hypothetical protein